MDFKELKRTAIIKKLILTLIKNGKTKLLKSSNY